MASQKLLRSTAAICRPTSRWKNRTRREVGHQVGQQRHGGAGEDERLSSDRLFDRFGDAPFDQRHGHQDKTHQHGGNHPGYEPKGPEQQRQSDRP